MITYLFICLIESIFKSVVKDFVLVVKGIGYVYLFFFLYCGFVAPIIMFPLMIAAIISSNDCWTWEILQEIRGTIVVEAMCCLWFLIDLYLFKRKRKKDTSFSDKSHGLAYEHQVAKKLSRIGYHGVKVTKATGDFGADVIATKRGVKYAIQCKHYTGKVGVNAVQQALSGKEYYKCNKAMVITNSTFTPAAVKLAKSTGVILMEKFKADTFIDEMEELDAIID